MIIDYKKFNEQAGLVATAMSEMDENTPASFELFLNRMREIGVIKNSQMNTTVSGALKRLVRDVKEYKKKI